MLERLLLAMALVGSLSGVTLAQTRAPATMTTLPSSNPQEFDLLDNTGNWMPFGYGDPINHFFQSGPVDVRTLGVQITGPAGFQATIVDPAGTFDNTPKINAACALGVPLFFPPGRYHIKDRVNCGTLTSGRIIGSGQWQTIFDVGSDFNLSAAGVFDLASQTGGQNTGQVSDIGVECYQNPADTVLSQLIQYPWVIYGSTPAGRPLIKNVYIGRCWNGIGFLNNFAPIIQGVAQLGVFNTPIDIDGALDYTFIDNVEIWPFGVSPNANLLAIWNANLPTAIFGRVDGLAVNNFTMFNANLTFNLNSRPCATGNTFNTLRLNGAGTITVNNGCIAVGNFALESADQSAPSLVVQGPYDSTQFLVAVCKCSSGHTTTSFIANHGGILNIASGWTSFNYLNTAPQIAVDSTIAPSRTMISNLQVHYQTGATPVASMIAQSGSGGLILDGIAIGSGNGAVAAPFVVIGNDIGANHLTNLSFSGWTGQTVSITPAASGLLGYYNLPDVSFPISVTPNFVTPGDFVPGSNVVTGSYKYLGGSVSFALSDTFNTNAYTTASGGFYFGTNLPYGAPAGGAQTISVALGALSNVTIPTGQFPIAEINYTNPIKIFPERIVSAAGWAQMGTPNILPNTTGVLFRMSGSYPVK